MRTVNFQNIVTRIHAPPGCLAPGIEDRVDIVLIHRLRNKTARQLIERTRRQPLPRRHAIRSVLVLKRSPILRRCVARRLAAGMTQLNGGNSVLFLNKIGQPSVHRNVIIVPDSSALIGFAASRFYTVFFTEDNARAADG